MRPSGLHLNKPVVFGLLGVVILVFVVTRIYMSGGLPSGLSFYNMNAVAAQGTGGKVVAAGRGMNDVVNKSTLNSVPELASDLKFDKKEDEVEVKLKDKTVTVHVVEMVNSKSDLSKALSVLLLHGAKFSSQNWLDTKTMEHLANWGHKAIAIDLPGKGKTKDVIDESHTDEFLAAFILKKSMERVVIVSPSMSGMYSLPYLFKEAESSTQRAVGFVPVAPVHTKDYREQYSKSQVQTLIVYGSKDIMGATTLNDLMLLPRHEIASIEGAGHPCYIDNPDAFHKVLFNFLSKLKS